MFSGPNQNIYGSDGIADEPYVIGANNIDRYPLMTSVIDTTPPVTIDDYDGLWHNTDFTITLTANDASSGVAETYYKINNGPTKAENSNGQPQITIEGVNNTLEYWSVDNAGNEELPHRILTGIKLDKTAPTAKAEPDHQRVSVGSVVTFDAWASEDNMDIVSYEWEFGDGSTGSGKTTTHTYANAGTYTVTLTVKDAANNFATHSITVTVRSTETPPPPAEAIPMWIIAAGAAITAIGIAVTATLLLRKRK